MGPRPYLVESEMSDLSPYSEPPPKRLAAAILRESKNAAFRFVYFFVDLYRMVDVNDFGRHITRNLGKRFIALSGVVTVFALVGEYTKNIVCGGEMDSQLTERFLENLLANFVFFGIPGALLLLATHLFSFFNRANYFTAQANYLNLLEMPKRTPAHLERLIDKGWSYVYASEFEIFGGDIPHRDLCRRVQRIEQKARTEEASLIAEIMSLERSAPGNRDDGQSGAGREAPSKAREKYRQYVKKARFEGYRRLEPWAKLTLHEKCSAIETLLREETVIQITREGLLYCEAGFKFNARWALATTMHLNVKHRKSGIDLKLIEDWLDGAFFDRTDTKLIEQYLAEATIKSAKIQARVPLFPFIMVQGYRTFLQRLWSFMLFGITSKRIGRYLNHLNQRYVREESAAFDRDYFKAEAFFWRSRTYDKVILEEIGQEALHRLETLREHWLFLTLGRLKRPRLHPGMTKGQLRTRLNHNTKRAIRNATRLLKRLFAGSVYNIHELRLRYDPDYVILIRNRGLAEFERMGLDLHYVERRRAGISRSYENVMAFRERLKSLLDPSAMKEHAADFPVDKEGERAIRIAYQIDERGFRQLVDREHQGRPDLLGAVYRRMEEIVSHKMSYSRKIRKLKTFETLAIHHLKNYINAVTRIYWDLCLTYRRELSARLERRQRTAGP